VLAILWSISLRILKIGVNLNTDIACRWHSQGYS